MSLLNKEKLLDKMTEVIKEYNNDCGDKRDINRVTFGDIFVKEYCKELFLDTKYKLPMITGIDELGKVIINDAKNFDNMLVVGKPRSGKSYYIASVLLSLMLLNSPEDIQFCIIDIKKSKIFEEMSLMPHVCGLHDGYKVNRVIEDIVEVEAQRRKKLLYDNRCDDIWSLNDRGIHVPVLYLVIDDYTSLISSLDEEDRRKFNDNIQKIISQLSCLGIRLLAMSHTSKYIMNNTNRDLIQFKAILSDECIEDIFGVNKLEKEIKNGDIAVKHIANKRIEYLRAVTLEDNKSIIKLIETAAKVLYKMGVNMPDMSSIRSAANKDKYYIKDMLV